MPTSELGSLTLALLLRVLGANLLGQLFARVPPAKRWSARSWPVSCSARPCSASSPDTAATLFGVGPKDPQPPSWASCTAWGCC
jgi:hypothetical protein